MPETGQFLFVRRRRRNGRNNSNKIATLQNRDSDQLDNDQVDFNSLFRSINNTLADIKDAAFTKFVFSQLTECLIALNFKGISEIICYGLGRFSQHKSVKYQLAFLLCLKARYNARVYIYDPIFCLEEIQILRALDLHIIETNEEAKRVVRDKTTLVFMPHCSRQLTNNFLYANWGDGLNNCILFVNSFTEVLEDCFRDSIVYEVDYILRIQPYVTEIQLKNSFAYAEIFNDLNIHFFTKQDLLRVPSDFWNYREEPEYSKDQFEFVAASSS